MAGYEDRYWWSRDGLRLHYRDYAGPADRPPIICVPGLTRNARDFEAVAERLAGQWRVICVELRGRAESAYAKDPMTYVPLTYLQDLEVLFEQLQARRFIGFGTSLGGIMFMLVAAAGRGRLAGALLNDIGPTLDPAGVERVRDHVGNGGAHPSWVHAARAVAENESRFFPDYTLTDWLVQAKHRFRLNSKGRIVLDYDQRIAEPFRVPGGEVGVDLWPAWQAFGDCPLLVVRGELSDFLSAETAARMATSLPDVELLEMPRLGHTPTLTEPAVEDAIDRLLARVAEAERRRVPA